MKTFLLIIGFLVTTFCHAAAPTVYRYGDFLLTPGNVLNLMHVYNLSTNQDLGNTLLKVERTAEPGRTQNIQFFFQTYNYFAQNTGHFGVGLRASQIENPNGDINRYSAYGRGIVIGNLQGGYRGQTYNGIPCTGTQDTSRITFESWWLDPTTPISVGGSNPNVNGLLNCLWGGSESAAQLVDNQLYSISIVAPPNNTISYTLWQEGSSMPISSGTITDYSPSADLATGGGAFINEVFTPIQPGWSIGIYGLTEYWWD